MAITIVRHKVKDFGTWRKAFDDFAQARKDGGEQSATVVQVEGDPNDVIVINTWPSVDTAKKFFEKPELKETMEKAGVSGSPEFTFGNDS